MKRSKRYSALREKIDRSKRYSLDEAVKLLKDGNHTKFNESVEVAVRLGVNPKHADQMVRATVSLPHGDGRQVRVAVFAQGDKATEATEAGADFVGSDDLGEKIKGGWTDFDVAIATPDQMKVVGKLGKILGPRGLMPNPKTGTVTMDITKTVKEVKSGRIEFRVDRQSNVAVSVGKVSFEEQKIVENVHAFVNAILRAKPSAAKGAYFLGASICSTMGPGIKLDHQELVAATKK
ncbi:MAG: 50S ribosomal protein L1 [Candidatus Zixiibacteriota bacterium]|nr:MAG: 50S ribosomal protein L1 [candidate division Zixibacteria bacterium]